MHAPMFVTVFICGSMGVLVCVCTYLCVYCVLLCVPVRTRICYVHKTLGMRHTAIGDVQLGKLRVKYDTVYDADTPYDTSLVKCK